MKIIKSLLVMLCAGAAFSIQAQTATVPHLINYQGMLVDANGVPMTDGDYTLTFNIYSNSAGGSRVWGPQIFDGLSTPGHGPKATLIGGRFNLVLGPVDTNGVSGDIVNAMNGTNRYIEITVGGTTNIVPRQQILSAPFALKADASDGLSLSGYNAVFGNTNIGGAFIPGNKIQNASITTVQIAPSAVSNAQIASNAVSADKLQIPLLLTGNNAQWLLELHNTGGPGVAGFSSLTHGLYGNGLLSGVYGVTGDGTAVRGEAQANGVGVYGEGRPGVRGFALSGGNAAEFYGNVLISGSITKPGGTFKIDHPLDPMNKYLYHSFVESSDMKNIYDGIVTLDNKGEAIVTLPAWFEPLNKDFRYQLTSIGAPGPNLFIADEISNNQFKIGGGTKGMKVSWQVTGIRHDAWAAAHPLAVEETKPDSEKGTYLAPEEQGKPVEKGLRWKRRQETTLPKN